MDKHNWKTLNKDLMEMTEQEVLNHLKAELVGSKRQSFLLRLHGRYNVLRCERERAEILSGTYMGGKRK